MTQERLQEIADDIASDVINCQEEWRVVIEKTVEHLRLAIKEGSEEKDEVIRRLSLATDSDSEVGSCDCLTKSPDIQHHKKGCKYRLIVERDEAREAVRRLAEGTPFRGLEADKVVDVMNISKSTVS